MSTSPGLRWIRFFLLCLLSARSLVAAPQIIHPGALWPDDRGIHINAHGGDILKLGDTYYWFGEDRSSALPEARRHMQYYASKDIVPFGIAPRLDPSKRYVSCYSSQDLVHWTFRNRVLQQSDPENFGPKWVLERPKVFYNRMTKKFVMYMHIDGPLHGKGGYRLARVGMGVFCNDRAMYDLGKEYYLEDRRETDPGCDKSWLREYVFDNGQNGDSYRDQGHSQGALAHLAECAQTAWNQGDDLWSAYDNLLLKGYEYCAKYNFGV